MSRFRIPPRIGPSPAATEPGQQNAVARLRSSRDAQSRLLADRRSGNGAETGEQESSDSHERAIHADGKGILEKSTDDEARQVTKVTKVKLVVLYRLPLALEPEVYAIASRAQLTVDYVMRALAHKGRGVLRALAGAADVAPFVDDFTSAANVVAGTKIVGDPMTVYVRSDALAAMHQLAGDPWQVLPRATVVGGYFTAIVSRLVKAYRAG